MSRLLGLPLGLLVGFGPVLGMANLNPLIGSAVTARAQGSGERVEGSQRAQESQHWQEQDQGRGRVSDEEGTFLRVMTFNIRHGEGFDGRLDLARVAEVIRETAPDIVGLQEVDQNWAARSQFVEQATWLARELGMEFAFAPAMRRGSLLGAEPGYGNALLSRYPIVHSETVTLPRLDTREDRSLLVAQVRLGHSLIQVGVTHLGLSSTERLQHVRIIREKLMAAGLPTLLMGDWNDRPNAPEVKALTDRWVNVTATFLADRGGMLPTFRYHSPDGQPNVQIDYIFASPEFHVCAVRTIATLASDHLPLVADLRINLPASPV